MPSGQVCVGDGGVPVSKEAYCDTGEDCDDGECEAMRWWTSCDGRGNCRSSTDTTDAYKERVSALGGASLTNACETDGGSPCDASKQCVGNVLYAARSCDGMGACSLPAAPMSCGNYACDNSGPQCKVQCFADADCIPDYLCTESRCHWNWAWVAWPVGGVGNYTINQGVVIDNRSGLMWQRDLPDGGMIWDAGIGYCGDLILGGHSDWRLPTRVELLSIVDAERQAPAIDGIVFPNTPSSGFWTSTPYVGMSGSVWLVSFEHGASAKTDAKYSTWVRCVR